MECVNPVVLTRVKNLMKKVIACVLIKCTFRVEVSVNHVIRMARQNSYRIMQMNRMDQEGVTALQRHRIL